MGLSSVVFAGLSAGVTAAVAMSADAQLPGAPVLQSAWATPGTAVALDVAGGAGRSLVAAAGSWTPVRRVQLTGGLGFQSGGSVASGAAYGVRIAMPFGSPSSSFGFALFGGLGGGERERREFPRPVLDSVTNSSEIVVGGSIGWAHSLFATRSLALSVAPAGISYQGGSDPGALVRVALGADVSISESLGVTVGMDVGRNRARGVGGPTGPQFGIGLTYAMNRR
jgi:hypothetical protein